MHFSLIFQQEEEEEEELTDDDDDDDDDDDILEIEDSASDLELPNNDDGKENK